MKVKTIRNPGNASQARRGEAVKLVLKICAQKPIEYSVKGVFYSRRGDIVSIIGGYNDRTLRPRDFSRLGFKWDGELRSYMRWYGLDSQPFKEGSRNYRRYQKLLEQLGVIETAQ